MPHYATKKYTYAGQLGLLLLFIGAGMILGGILSAIPLLSKIKLADIISGSGKDLLNDFMKEENAGLLRLMQFISTLCLFFLPTVLYAKMCHQKPFVHIGLNTSPNFRVLLLMGLIMVVSAPVVSSLQEFTQHLPWSKDMLDRFRAAENQFNEQVVIMGRMNNFSDFLVSLLIVAFLPALFEEVLFRGGLQNLLSRWTQKPILALIITSVVFSAIHGSYLGFLSRGVLGFILGWVFYRTNNLWISIFGHFINNGLALVVLYASSSPGKKIDPAAMEDHFPIVLVVISAILLVYLFRLFEKVAANQIDHPGEEVMMPGYTDFDPTSWTHSH